MIKETRDKSGFSYEIRLINHLEPHWTTCFEGWAINNLEDGEVLLCNNDVDQAGLYGVLNKIRDLNLTLLTIKKKKDEE